MLKQTQEAARRRRPAHSSLVVGVGAAVGAAKLGSRPQESAAVIADAATELGVSSAELTAALKKAHDGPRSTQPSRPAR